MTSTNTLDDVAEICEALGVRRPDWHLLARWARNLADPAELDRLNAYIDVMIAQRCRTPGSDLLSALIAVQFDGAELTTEDIRSCVVTLLGVSFQRTVCPARYAIEQMF